MNENERPLTGLRVKVGTAYGVARVRYTEGHTRAGHYEVERADGSSFLAPFDACEVGQNWDVTPEAGRFVGSEIFRPAFLDGTGRQFLSTDAGVIVPGDMARLQGLTDKIKPGWLVDWFSYGCNEFRGEVTVSKVSATGIEASGSKGQRLGCAWPQGGDDFEVRGNKLYFFRVPPRRTGKSRYPFLSLAFQGPRGGRS